MDAILPELTAEDLAFRRAASAYFEDKGKLARNVLDEKNQGNFTSFEEHWRDFFAPSDPDKARAYLATPFEVRQAQFERFRRLCHSWEDTFRHGARRPPPAEPAKGGGNGAGAEANDLKRRLEALRLKEEEVRELHGRLDSMLDRERARRSHPAELLTHLRVLSVPYDASIEDIKKQYKRLARLHHPDRRGDPAKMSRISDAYHAILTHYR